MAAMAVRSDSASSVWMRRRSASSRAVTTARRSLCMRLQIVWTASMKKPTQTARIVTCPWAEPQARAGMVAMLSA